MTGGYLAPEPEVLKSPAVCHTPACRGPATIWRIGRLMLNICQGCAAHHACSNVEQTQAHASGYPVEHPNYNTPEV